MSADTKSLMDMAYDERSDLASFLQTLTAEEWNAASLCDMWTVKDVVAHIVSYEELSILGLLKRFAKGRVVYANEVGVKEFAHMSPDRRVWRDDRACRRDYPSSGHASRPWAPARRTH